jgi:hypothetical protein
MPENLECSFVFPALRSDKVRDSVKVLSGNAPFGLDAPFRVSRLEFTTGVTTDGTWADFDDFAEAQSSQQVITVYSEGKGFRSITIARDSKHVECTLAVPITQVFELDTVEIESWITGLFSSVLQFGATIATAGSEVSLSVEAIANADAVSVALGRPHDWFWLAAPASIGIVNSELIPAVVRSGFRLFRNQKKIDAYRQWCLTK